MQALRRFAAAAPRLAAALAGLCAATATAAQPVAAPVGRSVHWSWEWWILLSIALAAVGYASGVIRLNRRLHSMRILNPRRVIAFAGGLGAIFIALVSPVDSIADQLFWVHMVQHLLLMLAAAPLLVLGRPAIAFMWAFGPRGRKRVGRLWSMLGLRAGVSALMHPLVVWMLFCGAFVVWHFPVPYQLALRNEGIHTLEHMSFLITALMFWSIIIEPSGRRRLDHPATLAFIVTAAILSALPAALIALAPRPLYPAYAMGDAAWGVTLLEDQQLAGVVMWVPGGAVYLAAAALIFLSWLKQDAVGARAAGGRMVNQVARPLLLLLCMSAVLSGCSASASQDTGAGIGDPEHGRALIAADGCGACHLVPGVPAANGMVGPPLTRIASRIYLAGVLRNSPDNMVTWLIDPQSIVPGNAMPDIGLTEPDARDMAAYLFTLH